MPHKDQTKAQKQAWYADGLRFSCLLCGDCCRGEPGFVWISREQMDVVAKHLNLPLEKFKEQYTRKVGDRHSLIELANGDCVFWSGNGCTIYPVRPVQCRTFPFWPEYLRSRHTWSRVQMRCPGVGTGTLHDLEEIRQRLEQHRASKA
jgi:hypothetical protein